jgi:stage V sporulation protein AC
MDKESYKRIVKELSPKENRLKHFLIAFFVGGLIGLFGQIFVSLLTMCFICTQEVAYQLLCLVLIFFGTLLTALGFFDNWVSKCRSGLIIPTTGFAHSVQSSAIDYKFDGAVTGMGSNVFKLAGSVILYGIISSFALVVLRVALFYV